MMVILKLFSLNQKWIEIEKNCLSACHLFISFSTGTVYAATHAKRGLLRLTTYAILSIV